MNKLKHLPEVLHLTINHNGRVTLWDSYRTAQSAVEGGEVYIDVTVDGYLMSRFIVAGRAATDHDEGFTE